MHVAAPRAEIETTRLLTALPTHPVITASPDRSRRVAVIILPPTGGVHVDAASGPGLKGGHRVGHGCGSGSTWAGEERKADDSSEDGGVGEHVGGYFGA
ncbi:GPCR, PTH-type [Metarhizium robertsii ARSEF 23]|uniref:GPCR, PTH-type n=2 Tax=Metarhizium TaxID=5529 RepID=A0A0B2XG97_METRA